jgi:protein-tyrosine phosphatase
MMREILPRKLWLGSVADAKNIETVMDAGIVAVVDLTHEEMPLSFPRSMVYCRFPILDGQQDARQILITAIETLAALLKKDIPTLVYCSAGMSRSPAVAAAALSILQGNMPDDNLRQVVCGHPHDISPRLWEEVREIVGALRAS